MESDDGAVSLTIDVRLLGGRAGRTDARDKAVSTVVRGVGIGTIRSSSEPRGRRGRPASRGRRVALHPVATTVAGSAAELLHSARGVRKPVRSQSGSGLTSPTIPLGLGDHRGAHEIAFPDGKTFDEGLTCHVRLIGSARQRLIRRLGILASCSAVAAAAVITVSTGAEADSATPAPPLPLFTPTPTDRGPNFAFPHNLHQNQVTDADITAEREMCEWFNAQFDVLMDQINTFNGNLAANHDDYSASEQQADAVTANIDQSERFLDPRARTFTLQSNCRVFIADDDCEQYYPLFEANDFSPGLGTAIHHQHEYQEPQPIRNHQHLDRADQPLRERHPRLRGGA